MSDRSVEVVSYTDPWVSLTKNVRLGDLSGLLDLGSEYGLAGGTDLSSEDNPNVVISNSGVRIQFRGSAFGCLTFDTDDETGISATSTRSLDFTVQGTTLAKFDAEDGILVLNAAGNTVLRIARHGDVSTTGADIHGVGRFGVSSDTDSYVLLDIGNLYSNSIFSVRTNSGNIDNSQPLFYVSEESILGLQDGSVAHQATGIVKYTETFFEVSPMMSTGGASLYGMLDDTSACNAFNVYGLSDANLDTTHTTAGRGAIELYGGQLSAGSLEDVTSSGNIFVVRARRGGAWETIYMIDEDGDVFRDGGIAQYDEHDDARMVSDLYHVLCGDENSIVRYDKSALLELGAISGEGKLFVSNKVSSALVYGSIRQIRERQDTLIAAVNTLKEQIQKEPT